MKCADLIAKYLKSLGIDTVFGYQGSSISHTIDSISRMDGMQFVECRHEQGASFEAVGYALAKNGLGAAVSCSGPGATNMITGIADAWYDSVPVIFLVGQVSVKELRQDKGQRQSGFQEADIVSMVRGVTKYADIVLDGKDILWQLEKAVWIAKEGRKGPVLLEIPHNVQGMDIGDEDQLKHFECPYETFLPDEKLIKSSLGSFCLSSRPLLLIGGGFPFHQKETIGRFCEKSSIPVVCSYLGKDRFNNESRNYLGVIGVYGSRAANLAVRYCDCLLVLGSRLDGRQTGGDWDSFAPEAKIIAVDIDEHELYKSDRVISIRCEIEEFLKKLYVSDSKTNRNKWTLGLQRLKDKFRSSSEYIQPEGVNPNLLIETVCRMMPDQTAYSTDVGQNQIWTNASAIISPNSRLIQSGGLGSMGFALPASIGTWYAGFRSIVCFVGDGGFQMNIQELQVISENKVPVKIFIFNNKSLGLIRVYQNKALGRRHYGSVEQFSSPDYEMIAKAYGLSYFRVSQNQEIAQLDKGLKSNSPVIIEVIVSENSESYPEPTYKKKVFEQSPELSEDEIKACEEILI